MALVAAGLLCLACVGWIAVRIAKANAMLGLVSVVLWPVMIFALLRYWDDERSDIKVPFVVFVAAGGFAWHGLFGIDALPGP